MKDASFRWLVVLLLGAVGCTSSFAQENRISLKEAIDTYQGFFKHPKTPLVDHTQEGFLCPSPSQQISVFKEQQSTLLWENAKGKYVAKYVYRKGEMNDSLMEWVDAQYASVKNEKGMAMGYDIPFPDGTYTTMAHPLPYCGFYVDTECRTFSVKKGVASPSVKSTEIKDLYFKKARRAFYQHYSPLRLDGYTDWAKLLQVQMILIGSDFETYLTQVGIDTTFKGSVRACAYMDTEGRITFHTPNALDAKSEEAYKSHIVLQYLNDWAKTLPPFAFNGYYTLDGRFLPVRFFEVLIHNGIVSFGDQIEDSREFQHRRFTDTGAVLQQPTFME